MGNRVRWRILSSLICLSLMLIAALPAYAQPDDSEILVEPAESISELEPLIFEWRQTDVDTPAEQSIERRIRSLLQQVDPGLVAALYQYWLSPSDSAEEAVALERIENAVPPDIADVLKAIYRPESFSPQSSPNFDVVGDQSPIEIQPVDIVLSVPESLVAGESVTVFGTVTNHGEKPVWIVDMRSRLTVPQELWGVSTDFPLSLFADFPTTPTMMEESLRLEAGSSHTMFWTIDRVALERLRDEARLADLESACTEGDTEVCKEHNDKQSALKRSRDNGPFLRTIDQTIDGLWTYLFFRPREYQLNADVHVWPVPPEYGSEFVTNLGDSFTITTSRMVRFDAPQMVLVAGAILGGLIAFFLKITYQTRPTRPLTLTDFAFGIPSVVLLCVIGTIMLARLGETDFLINVQVQDFWGAVLTGFIIQWLGLNYVVEQLTRRAPSGESRGGTGRAERAGRESGDDLFASAKEAAEAGEADGARAPG